jgi:SAM-dependent methyltransferase
LTPEQPYQQIAAFYDRLMSHVDYPKWVRHVRDLWQEHHGGSIESVFDAACGTGRFLEIMREPKMHTAGCDQSSAMIEIARKRLQQPSGDDLQVQDLRCLSRPRVFDLVTCLYDSVNYLLTEADMRLALQGLKRLCQPDGLIVFDICTERNSLDHFLDYRDASRVAGYSYERHSYYDRQTRLHCNDFSIWKNEDHHDGVMGSAHVPLFVEKHVQRIWRIQELQVLIASVGLQELACYAEFDFYPGDENADRVHFVLSPRP